jgi:hypothetical protein
MGEWLVKNWWRAMGLIGSLGSLMLGIVVTIPALTIGGTKGVVICAVLTVVLLLIAFWGFWRVGAAPLLLLKKLQVREDSEGRLWFGRSYTLPQDREVIEPFKELADRCGYDLTAAKPQEQK